MSRRRFAALRLLGSAAALIATRPAWAAIPVGKAVSIDGVVALEREKSSVDLLVDDVLMLQDHVLTRENGFAELLLDDRTRVEGPCMPRGGKMWCGVECDGGSVLISTRNGGDILVDLAAVGGIAMSMSCGEEDFEQGFMLEPGADDKTFLLHALPAQICEPVFS